MAKINISELKKSILDDMLADFRRNGCVEPNIFYLQNTIEGPYQAALTIVDINRDSLSNYEAKHRLSEKLREVCENPNTVAAGLIFEANYVKFDDDNKLKNLIESGAVRISELKEKQHIILMMFSTPVKEELFIYHVDVENKKIGKKLKEPGGFTGPWSNLFGWKKN